VHAIGDDAGLCARQRNGVEADCVQGHRGQRDRRLLAGRQQHVHLTLARQRHDFLGELDQIVRHAAHGGHHHDNLVPGFAILRDAPGDILNPVGITDGSAAIFLHDEHPPSVRTGIPEVNFFPRRTGHCESKSRIKITKADMESPITKHQAPEKHQVPITEPVPGESQAQDDSVQEETAISAQTKARKEDWRRVQGSDRS
jgi:hypothetical protein